MDQILHMDCPLFRGIDEAGRRALLPCLRSHTRRYARGEYILRAGTPVEELGIVLSGGVCIQVDDIWGNTGILSYAEPGNLFAEAYACRPEEPLMVNAVAAAAAEVLFLNVQRLLRLCDNACGHHTTLIRNLLTLMAEKNLQLSRRSLYTAPKTIRSRLLSYLSAQSMAQGSRSVTIPFNRQQLADYLNVERSALSNELSKMQRDGLIRVEKNRFHLLPRP